VDDQTPTYSWLERPRVRLITISTIYLLGVVSTIVIQLQSVFAFGAGLPLALLFFLPTGYIEGAVLFFPSARFLFDKGSAS
jgi:hypothetical protein